MNNAEILDIVNSLIEVNKDGEYGFLTCADRTRRPGLQLLFEDRADKLRSFARDLQLLAANQLSGRLPDHGTVGGAMRRGWVGIKGAFDGYSDLALIEECECGEDIAHECYRDALDKGLPLVVRGLVERQHDDLKRHRAQLRRLREYERVAQS